METLRNQSAIDEWLYKPVFLAHPAWFEPPAKWAKKESDINEAEQVILLSYLAIFCAQHNIAAMQGSLVGPQYPLEAIRHVHDILFGRHRRSKRHKQEKRIQLQEGGRAHLPPFCTTPAPPFPDNPSEYPPLNKEVKLPERKKQVHITFWMKTYSRIPPDKNDALLVEAQAYCFRFNIPFKDNHFPPTVLKHVHDSMYPPFWRYHRKKTARKLQYAYKGYAYDV